MTDGEVRHSARVARKQHRCVWCNWVIPPGTRYRFQVYSYEGYLSNAHWHEACVEDSYQVFKGKHEFEFTPGDGEQPFPGLTEIDRALCAAEAERKEP